MQLTRTSNFGKIKYLLPIVLFLLNANSIQCLKKDAKAPLSKNFFTVCMSLLNSTTKPNVEISAMNETIPDIHAS